MTEHKHHTHPAVVKRLRRAEGHLRSVTAMIEAGRPCLEVAQQLAAIESAITNAKSTFIRDHIDHCLNGAATGGDARLMLAELKAITKFL